MEIHPTWFIVVGLGFDIVGAALIISPILNYVIRKKTSEMEHESYYYEPKQFVTDDFKKEWYKQLWARMGIVLLGFGFFLQMVGNWIQNPPF